MSLSQRWENETQPLQPLNNSQLVCNTCKNCTKSATGCEVFAIKPISVLKGGVCYEYKKK